MTATLTPTTDRASIPTASERAFLRQLGKNLRIARVTCELSQQSLATAAGMSRNFVSSVERGAHGIDILRVLRLATVLGVSWDTLVPPIPEAGPQ